MTNLQRIETIYDAFEQGDLPVVLHALDDDIEWIEAEGWPYAGHYHGSKAVVENVFKPLGQEWDNFRIDAEEFIDGGDTIVVQGWYSGTFRATGSFMRAAFAHVWKLEDGKIVRYQQYTDTLKIDDAMNLTVARLERMTQEN